MGNKETIKRFFDFNSVNIRAAYIAALIPTIIALFSLHNSCRSTRIAENATSVAEKSYKLSETIYKSKDIPRLIAAPLGAEFFIPAKPEVEGQVKISISAVIENLSEVSARDVSLNFETEDWYGHKTNLFQIYKEAKMPVLHFMTLPKNSRILYPSYAPDAPASGEQGFIQQEKPFKLKLTLEWSDINNKKYVYVGFYNLKHSLLPSKQVVLYFQPLNTYDSVKDGRIAWDRAVESF